MDSLHSGFQTLGWPNEELDEEAEVTGSVVEFAFGPDKDSYVATSYPYRPHYAKDDPRSIATHNLPEEIWHKITLLRPRYVMHIAFRRPLETWVIYCYRGARYAYDSKWQPRKPDHKSDSLGRLLADWKEIESDQISYCAFGDHADKWFVRSTNGTTEWNSQPGPGLSEELKRYWNQFERLAMDKKRKDGKTIRVSTIRAATLGPGDTWILYSQTDFVWSKHGLPAPLIAALKLGKKQKWIINKAVLNPYNRCEYVLVYDDGAVYCAFHEDFRKPFEKIIGEWSQSKRRYEKWPADRVANINWIDPRTLDRPTSPASQRSDAEGEYFKEVIGIRHVVDLSSSPNNLATEGGRPLMQRQQRLSNNTDVSRLSNTSMAGDGMTGSPKPNRESMTGGATHGREGHRGTNSGNDALEAPQTAGGSRLFQGTLRTHGSPPLEDIGQHEIRGSHQTRIPNLPASSGGHPGQRWFNARPGPSEPAAAGTESDRRPGTGPPPQRSSSSMAPERRPGQNLRLREGDYVSPQADVQAELERRQRREHQKKESAPTMSRWEHLNNAFSLKSNSRDSKDRRG